MTTIKKVRVAAFMPTEPDQVRRIEAVGPEVIVDNVGRWKAVPGDEDVLGRADVVLSWTAKFSRQQAPALRWYHCLGAGVEHLIGLDLFTDGVVLTNSAGIHGGPISDFVMSLILSMTRDIPRILRHQSAREWPKGPRTEFMAEEMSGKTMGIMGYGSIGRNLAVRAKGFGMRVIALTQAQGKGRRGLRYPSPDIEPDARYGRDQLHEFLGMSDFVVVCLPATPETFHMIGTEEIAAMKATAYLVNVARGSIIDEVALAEALRSRRIKGAALDVFEKEPLPADSPLYDLDNVIISPHVAGYFAGFYDRGIDFFCDNLGRFIRGEPMMNVVEPEVGY